MVSKRPHSRILSSQLLRPLPPPLRAWFGCLFVRLNGGDCCFVFGKMCREPIGRVLYNRLVDIRDKVQPRSHGNYMPSLDLAEQMLRDDYNQPSRGLVFLFLSDGRPSDNATGIVRGSNQAVSQAMCVGSSSR